MRGGTKSDLIPPHSRQGFALPPSPRRGFYSSSSPSERDRWVCAENQPLYCRTFGAMWASPPTRMVRFYHSAGPGLCLRGSAPHPSGLRPATFPVGEGCLPAGDEGRTSYRPTPVRAFGPATLSQERVLAYSSSSFRTAMKASLGTDTVPKVRIRFLPSFCFSSSFFFRVMSPP